MTLLFTLSANPVAVLSTVGNVVLEKNVQGIWRAGLHWPAGRTLATPEIMKTLFSTVRLD